MKVRGKNVGRSGKALTEVQLALYERAKKENWFEHIKKQNLCFAIKRNVKGLLDDLRVIFPNNYVGKDKDGDKWVYTIYCGDKEFNEMMHKPLRFENPKTTMKNYLKELK